MTEYSHTSLKKRVTRFQGTKELIYITDRVVAAPFPKSERELKDIQNILEAEHPGHYKIYNVSDRKWNYSRLNCPVSEFFIERGQPPTLETFRTFVEDIYKWLDISPLNIIVVHCRGRKRDRSVVMISAWLVASGYCTSVSEAMQLVGKMLNPLEHPSQIRYLKYYGKSLKTGMPPKDRFIFLHKIRLNTIPNFKFTGGCDPWFSIFQQGKKVFYTKKLKGAKGKTVVDFSCRDISLAGDIKIEFYHKDYRKVRILNDSENQMFWFAFNTSFEELTGNKVTLYKRDLDIACKDIDNHKFYPNFKVELFFITTEKMHEVRKKQREEWMYGNPNTSYEINIAKTVSELLSDEEQKNKKKAEEGRAICSVCKAHIFDEECSICLSPTEIVHWACMKCGRCGQSLQQTSQNRQCVIQGGRMICETCMEEFFPKCQQCKESITGKKMVAFGDLRWHLQCALCSECKKPLSNETQPPFHVKRGLLFCSICAVHSPYHDDTVEEHTLTPRQEELLFTIKDPMASDYFSQYLSHTPDNKAGLNALELWKDIERYKLLPDKELRVKKGEDIINSYLKPESLKLVTLSEDLKQNVIQNVKDGDTELFTPIQRVVFNTLENDHYVKFVDSNHYQKYLEALRAEPDPDLETEMHVLQVVEAFLENDNIWEEPNEAAVVSSPRSSEPPKEPPKEEKPSQEQPPPKEEPKPTVPNPSSASTLPSVEPNMSTNNRDSTLVSEPKNVDNQESLVCSRCKRPIGSTESSLEHKGNSYHWNCFTCAHCGVQLGTSQFFEKEPGVFYCVEDYKSFFAPRCAACNGLLKSKYANFSGKRYHPECLVCTICGIQLATLKFFVVDDLTYCQNCVNKLPAK